MVKFESDIVRDTLEKQEEQMVEWGRGNNQPLAMTEGHVTDIVNRIAEAVARQQQAEALENYKQMARLESALADAKNELARRDREISGLRDHIAKFQRMLVMMTPGAGEAEMITTAHLPTYHERLAADVPVPDYGGVRASYYTSPASPE